ncbi:MAG TPA: zinc ribbon domain-containing protein [Candidatus Peribacterales bacterium]|nr:zinc ribbon domain-containing protein [Candidatus Peribacterales bacterium]
MPLYDFECSECNEKFELEHPRGAEPPACPICGSTDTEILLTPQPVIFKGGGFYKTDSAHRAKETPKGTKQSEAHPIENKPEKEGGIPANSIVPPTETKE